MSQKAKRINTDPPYRDPQEPHSVGMRSQGAPCPHQRIWPHNPLCKSIMTFVIRVAVFLPLCASCCIFSRPGVMALWMRLSIRRVRMP